jgi:hypothetical protein
VAPEIGRRTKTSLKRANNVPENGIPRGSHESRTNNVFPGTRLIKSSQDDVSFLYKLSNPGNKNDLIVRRIRPNKKFVNWASADRKPGYGSAVQEVGSIVRTIDFHCAVWRQIEPELEKDSVNSCMAYYENRFFRNGIPQFLQELTHSGFGIGITLSPWRSIPPCGANVRLTRGYISPKFKLPLSGA